MIYTKKITSSDQVILIKIVVAENISIMNVSAKINEKVFFCKDYTTLILNEESMDEIEKEILEKYNKLNTNKEKTKTLLLDKGYIKKV